MNCCLFWNGRVSHFLSVERTRSIIGQLSIQVQGSPKTATNLPICATSIAFQPDAGRSSARQKRQIVPSVVSAHYQATSCLTVIGRKTGEEISVSTSTPANWMDDSLLLILTKTHLRLLLYFLSTSVASSTCIKQSTSPGSLTLSRRTDETKTCLTKSPCELQERKRKHDA
jgi:hypothetical protein